MTPQTANKFTYDLRTITRNVPPSPGVYSVFSGGECVYAGTADDICAGLLELYFESNPRLDEKEFTHFSFDLIAPDSRGKRSKDGIREFASA
jgi:hypothetical protein